MSWALWLSAPVVATLLAALWVWWRGRPEKPPTSDQTIQDHRDYLAALGRSPIPGRKRR